MPTYTVTAERRFDEGVREVVLLQVDAAAPAEASAKVTALLGDATPTIVDVKLKV